eukprot:c43297_g1_i1 orf=298-1665(-)
MQRFCFPILDRKDILKHLHELGAAKLTEENLVKPTPDTVWQAYQVLLAQDPFTEESPQPVFDLIDCLGNPELHTESVGNIHSFLRIRKLMDAAGADGFSCWDIMRPETQRTTWFLSAGINFCMHRKAKLDYLAEIQESRDAELMKGDELCEVLEQIQSQVTAIEADRLAQYPQVQALEVETKDLEHQISALNKQQSSLQLDIRNLKQESNDIADKIGNLNFILMEKQQEGAQLQSQIIDNPEKVQKTLEEKKEALEEETALAEKAFLECQKWKAKLEIISKAERKLQKYENLLQSFEEQVNAQKSAEKDVKVMKAKLKALEKEEWAVEARGLELNEDAQRLKDLIDKLEQQKALRCEEDAKESDTSRLQYAQFMQQFEERQQLLADKKKQIEAVQKAILERRADKEESIARIHAAKAELREKFREYNCSILTSIASKLANREPTEDMLAKSGLLS